MELKFKILFCYFFIQILNSPKKVQMAIPKLKLAYNNKFRRVNINNIFELRQILF